MCWNLADILIVLILNESDCLSTAALTELKTEWVNMDLMILFLTSTQIYKGKASTIAYSHLNARYTPNFYFYYVNLKAVSMWILNNLTIIFSIPKEMKMLFVFASPSSMLCTTLALKYSCYWLWVWDSVWFNIILYTLLYTSISWSALFC